MQPRIVSPPRLEGWWITWRKFAESFHVMFLGLVISLIRLRFTAHRTIVRVLCIMSFYSIYTLLILHHPRGPRLRRTSDVYASCWYRLTAFISLHGQSSGRELELKLLCLGDIGRGTILSEESTILSVEIQSGLCQTYLESYALLSTNHATELDWRSDTCTLG
jgi:hypothetical protein